MQEDVVRSPQLEAHPRVHASEVVGVGQVRSLRDEFLHAYFSQRDLSIAARVPLYESLIHLKRACKRFRWQDEPGWEQRVRRQILQAVVCLELMQQTTTPRNLADVLKIYDRCPATA